MPQNSPACNEINKRFFSRRLDEIRKGDLAYLQSLKDQARMKTQEKQESKSVYIADKDQRDSEFTTFLDGLRESAKIARDRFGYYIGGAAIHPFDGRTTYFGCSPLIDEIELSQVFLLNLGPS